MCRLGRTIGNWSFSFLLETIGWNRIVDKTLFSVGTFSTGLPLVFYNRRAGPETLLRVVAFYSFFT